ncbi:unnamed protein product [Phytophthora fragariaefolia]|uniref:Unnamed protein product n=1 Tax=Phytophthora fragariaefolia TaxID=1490495 RepID=A0A9W6XA04_9STRA|nr:unnamed protein product [Phytophthora fragariaefolia]
MPRKDTRSSYKAPAKKAAGAPKPKAKHRGQASALAEATAAASAAFNLLVRPRIIIYALEAPGSPADPERVLYSGGESDPHEAEGSHSAASSAPAAPASREGETRPSPSQADPQAKAARTTSDPDTGCGQRSLPVRNLTLSEGLARVRGAATQPQGATAAQEEPASSRKRSASQSPRRKARDSFRGMFDSSSDDEEGEGKVPEPQEISNDLDGQRERYHAAQLQSRHLPSAQASVPVQSTQTDGGKAYPRGYYPHEEGTGAASFLEKLQDPRGLVGVYTTRGAFERELVMNEPLFQANIEAARCVLLAPDRIPLKEFLVSVRSRRLRVDSTPSGVTLGSNPKGPLASLKPSRSFGRGSLSKDTNAKSWINSKRNLRCPLSWTSANSALSSTTSSLFASLAWVTALVMSAGAGASHERAAPGEHAPHGSGGLRSGHEEPEQASYDYEPPTTAGGSRSPSKTVDPAVALQQEEMRLFCDRLYAIKIALGLGPGGHAASQSGKQWALEDLCAEVQSLRHEIRDLHDRVDRRAAVGEVATLRQVHHRWTTRLM